MTIAQLDAILSRFCEARKRGAIQALEQVWSPADTLADTRYRVRETTGECRTLLQSEVHGYLAGLGV